LAAEGAAELGVDPDDVVVGLTEAAAVPGRMERVFVEGAEAQPTVLVDYAHTPAGLESVLSAVAELKRPGSRTVVVFGCGGNKDQAKRPLMGRIAVGMADLVVVTSDNPRDEDPLVIIEQIKTGIDTAAHRRAEVLVEPDRARAIALGIARADGNDVVLVAGRGHETHQEVRGERVPFDDRQVALEVLSCSP
jgi:UDP-N-acetylmuramoyl-L-alanyl-D-glutamate--2,6-diaminopimelate ligase